LNVAPAKRALHEMMYAESKASCEAEKKRFVEEYQGKYPKAVESLTADWEHLLTFFDFPAEHWKHLRTTNPIESTFATVKLRTRVTKGAGSREAGLTMAFKLIQSAEKHWRRLDGQELIPLVRAGVKFVDHSRLGARESDLRSVRRCEGRPGRRQGDQRARVASVGVHPPDGAASRGSAAAEQDRRAVPGPAGVPVQGTVRQRPPIGAVGGESIDTAVGPTAGDPAAAVDARACRSHRYATACAPERPQQSHRERTT